MSRAVKSTLLYRMYTILARGTPNCFPFESGKYVCGSRETTLPQRVVESASSINSGAASALLDEASTVRWREDGASILRTARSNEVGSAESDERERRGRHHANPASHNYQTLLTVENKLKREHPFGCVQCAGKSFSTYRKYHRAIIGAHVVLQNMPRYYNRRPVILGGSRPRLTMIYDFSVERW